MNMFTLARKGFVAVIVLTCIFIVYSLLSVTDFNPAHHGLSKFTHKLVSRMSAISTDLPPLSSGWPHYHRLSANKQGRALPPSDPGGRPNEDPLHDGLLFVKTPQQNERRSTIERKEDFPEDLLSTSTTPLDDLPFSTPGKHRQRLLFDRERKAADRDKDKQEESSAHQHKLTQKEVAQRFRERLETLREACKRYKNSSMFRPQKKVGIQRLGPFPPVMNVSVGYCPIQKTGSTTWSGILRSIYKKMSEIRVKEVRRAAEPDFLFVFVREPYSRLLSAYVDKLFSPNTLFWKSTGRYIIEKFRENPSQHSLHCGHDVTFPEFVRYVIHAQTTGQHRDGHFTPTHDHCGMCEKPYTHVGHLETLSEDMPYLLNITQSPVSYSKNFDNSTLSNNAGWVLARMRTKILECMSMQEACLRLWKKWHIRGIISKAEPVPFTPGRDDHISKEEFVKRAEAALQRSGPKEDRKLQKTEALREAFASVPLEDRLQIQKLLFLDFALFGFDQSPDSVFPQTSFQADDGYSYFDIRSD